MKLEKLIIYNEYEDGEILGMHIECDNEKGRKSLDLAKMAREAFPERKKFVVQIKKCIIEILE